MDESRGTQSRPRTVYRWRDAVLARASDVLTRSLDYDVTLRSIARLGIPQLADWTSVYVPGDGGVLAPRLVLAHRSARKEALLSTVWQQRPVVLPDGHPLIQAIDTGSPVIASADPATGLHPALGGCTASLNVLRRVGVRTVLAVPLPAHGEVLGSMMMVKARQTRPLAQDDPVLEIATDLAGCAAQAIYNARLFRETKLAVRVRDENMVSATHHLLELLAALREHSDGLREETAEGTPPRRSQLRRGLAHIELLAREMEHLIRELHAASDVQAFHS